VDYSYEEIRQVVIDILSGQEKGRHIVDVNQFGSLESAVAKTFAIRAGALPNDMDVHQARLSQQGTEDFREIFWDLILQRIIVPGMNSSNPNLPFFKVTSRGEPYLGKV